MIFCVPLPANDALAYLPERVDMTVNKRHSILQKFITAQDLKVHAHELDMQPNRKEPGNDICNSTITHCITARPAYTLKMICITVKCTLQCEDRPHPRAVVQNYTISMNGMPAEMPTECLEREGDSHPHSCHRPSVPTTSPNRRAHHFSGNIL